MTGEKRPLPEFSHADGLTTMPLTFARKSFDAPGLVTEGKSRACLDLGTVHDISRVRLNGKDLGVVWTAPWRVDITDAVRPAGNRLETTSGWNGTGHLPLAIPLLHGAHHFQSHPRGLLPASRIGIRISSGIRVIRHSSLGARLTRHEVAR